MTNFFDFNDVSDLPEELQKSFQSDQLEAAREYADIVDAGYAAGYSKLGIKQIIAAAIRMGKKPPTETTVRNYLNRAVEAGLIVKPTRATYGSLDADPLEADPLADI